MEHRWSQRKKLTASTIIFVKKLPVLVGRCANISRGGIFICTGETTIHQNCSVELELNFQNRRLVVPAMLVHKSSEGIGLMFNEMKASTRSLLAKLLQSNDNHPLRKIS